MLYWLWRKTLTHWASNPVNVRLNISHKNAFNYERIHFYTILIDSEINALRSLDIRKWKHDTVFKAQTPSFLRTPLAMSRSRTQQGDVQPPKLRRKDYWKQGEDNFYEKIKKHDLPVLKNSCFWCNRQIKEKRRHSYLFNVSRTVSSLWLATITEILPFGRLWICWNTWSSDFMYMADVASNDGLMGSA